MPWYLTSLMTHDLSGGGAAAMVRSREYWCIVLADDNSAAYLKSLNLGTNILERC
jgi:hypothetical protein